MQIVCLVEQENKPGMGLLNAAAEVTFHPLSDLMQEGWNVPLILLGDALNRPEAGVLLQRTYRNPASTLVLPPLPLRDITALLDAPAPLVVVRQRAEEVSLVDNALQAATGRLNIQVYCTEALQTALGGGTLAKAGDLPVIWAYRPTRAATPVILVAPQLLLVSARTNPLDRELLLDALLAWAGEQTRASADGMRTGREESGEVNVDPGLLRALVVAWVVQPNLTPETLPNWLEHRLFIQTGPAALDAALRVLRKAGILGSDDQPQNTKFIELVNMWGLHAWVREARRIN